MPVVWRMLALCGIVLESLCAAAQGGRQTYNFDQNWRVRAGDAVGAQKSGFDDAAWKRVTLPYAWNEDAAYRVSIYEHPTGIAWYRKHFSLPVLSPGDRVLLEFEGVRQAGEVFLNGHRMGLSENGVSSFGFDITHYLTQGDNVVAVRTDNRWEYQEQATGVRFQWNNNSFNANYGGINKRVWLHVVPAVHQTLPLYSSLGTTGQYIWGENFNIAAHTATLHAESQVVNDGDTPVTVRLKTDLLEVNGAALGSALSEPIVLHAHETKTLGTAMNAANLHFWSWGYGYLYDVKTSLVMKDKIIDSVFTRTGFRKAEFRNGMIYLNDRAIMVHGYAARSTNEWPALGGDVPPWVSDFTNGLIVEDNGDLIRPMHVTPSPQDMDSFARVGLLVSMPAGDSEGDPQGRQWDQRVELMRDQIIRHRNNPAVLFYESGNHGISDEHMAAMVALRNRWDPHGGRVIGAREMLNSHVAEYGGEMLYVNKSAYKPVWAHEYNRDEGARAFWNDATAPYHKDNPLYNRNQDSYTLEDVLRWDDYYRLRPGTGDRVSSGGVNISWFDENSHFRGDNNYRRSGEVDAMRLPKDAFYAHQVIWDGWVDIEHPRIHIAGHWNYAVGARRTVLVIANTPYVNLKLNGKSLGIQRASHDFLFSYPNISYESGRLEATGLDEKGKVVTRTTLETTGAPARIQLTPHTSPAGMFADGSDLALVDVEVLDAQGRRVPTANNMIRFRVDGPAEWRGGIAQGSSRPTPINTIPRNAGHLQNLPAPYLYFDNYILAKELPVECGVNRVSLRSTTEPGVITVTAESDGLEAAQIQWKTQRVEGQNGLSLFDPAKQIPLDLKRGETPLTPSFTVKRRSVKVLAATAGINANRAALSIDDDESTSWSNEGGAERGGGRATLENAWIEYTLAQPTLPTQIDLRMGAFKYKRYPIVITLDGKEIFTGTTTGSLGYVTLPLHAAQPGTKLRILLASAPVTVEDSMSLVEVNGTIDQKGTESKKSRPVLEIFEADIYGFAR